MKFTTLFTLLLCIPGFAAQASDDHVLLVSYDGFRHDYVEKFETPNFDALIASGVAAEGLIPIFPSKTFPNHYSIVTGMYPAKHGLVDNRFYDRKRKQTYSPAIRALVQDSYFYAGLPLWQLAQEQGLKSASYFWVGSEAPVAGRYPDYYHLYDGRVPNEARIRQVGEWLRLPEVERPRLITLYFSLVDTQGHRTGPDARDTGRVVEEADRLLGLILQTVRRSLLPVHVIVVSDHGMVRLSNNDSSFLPLDEILDPDQEGLTGVVIQGTHAHLYLDTEERAASLYAELTAQSRPFGVYLKAQTPEHWHYRDNDRIGDIIITAPLGKELSPSAHRPDMRSPFRGVHGYDPALSTDLHGIFYATGPRFRVGASIPAFENIHVYPLVAALLNLDPPDNIDGDIRVTQPLLLE